MRISSWTALGLFAAAALACGEARSADGPRHVDFGEMPRGHAGIACRYPGDAGIERDPGVVFHETFEAGGIDELKKRWTDSKDRTGKSLAFAEDAPPASRGKRALRMELTGEGAASTGTGKGYKNAHLWKLFKPGFDQLYARFYVKFAEDHPYIHHFVKMGAWRDSPNWPQGEAGHLHDGARSFQTGIEPTTGWGKHDPPGAWFLYTYWNGMKKSGDGRYWGNHFEPQKPAQAPRGKWQCVEFMVRCNSAPDKYDGAQAFWIDGRLTGYWGPGEPTGQWMKRGNRTIGKYQIGPGQPFEGFRWRTTNELKINTFWLLYDCDGVFRGVRQFQNVKKVARFNTKQTRVWFDDIVVATEYIGPIFTKKDDSEPTKASRAPAPSAQETRRAAAEKEAGRIYQMARQAERMGQRGVAGRLYEQIVEKYPETEVAAKARRKLSR